MSNIKLDMTKAPYSVILAQIHTGAVNAVHLHSLSRYTNIEERHLRKYIEQIRRSGLVIIGDNNGYYFPAETHELQQYIRREQKRINSTSYTLKSAMNLLNYLEIGGAAV